MRRKKQLFGIFVFSVFSFFGGMASAQNNVTEEFLELILERCPDAIEKKDWIDEVGLTPIAPRRKIEGAEYHSWVSASGQIVVSVALIGSGKACDVIALPEWTKENLNAMDEIETQYRQAMQVLVDAGEVNQIKDCRTDPGRDDIIYETVLATKGERHGRYGISFFRDHPAIQFFAVHMIKARPIVCREEYLVCTC